MKSNNISRKKINFDIYFNKIILRRLNMMIQKNQVLLNEFKKSYIFNKANEMAQDYEFIKGFTLNKVKTYIQLLSIF